MLTLRALLLCSRIRSHAWVQQDEVPVADEISGGGL